MTRPASFLPTSAFLSLRSVSLADDADLLGLVLLEPFGFGILDFLGAVVLGDAAAREHARVDDGAFDARRHAQAGVADLAGLFAEDRAQQFLFGTELGLALGRDLADQDVARPDVGADADDTAGVEVFERFLADVGDVAGDFLGSELGVARDTFEFLDMHRGEQVFLDHALGNQDRIFEVVAAPRHERDQHVAAQRQLAEVGRGTVGEHVAGLDPLALDHHRALVDAGALVGALILDQVVDIDAGVAQVPDLLVGAHDDPLGVDAFDDAVALAR